MGSGEWLVVQEIFWHLSSHSSAQVIHVQTNFQFFTHLLVDGWLAKCLMSVHPCFRCCLRFGKRKIKYILNIVFREEMPENILQQHQEHLIRWLEEKLQRNEVPSNVLLIVLLQVRYILFQKFIFLMNIPYLLWSTIYSYCTIFWDIVFFTLRDLLAIIFKCKFS